MIQFNENSWHRKLTVYSYGEYEMNRMKNKNLCPYMRKVVKSIIALPLVVLWKHSPTFITCFGSAWAKAMVIMTAIATTIHCAEVALNPEYQWWWVLAGASAIAGCIGGLVGAFLLAEYILEKRNEKRIRDKRAGKIRSPNLLKTYIKSRHDKFCPPIEFVNPSDSTNIWEKR